MTTSVPVIFISGPTIAASKWLNYLVTVSNILISLATDDMNIVLKPREVITPFKWTIGVGLTALLVSCGGGGGGSSNDRVLAPDTKAPPTYVTKDYTISMSEASVKRISNGDAVDVDTSGIEGSGTVVVSQ